MNPEAGQKVARLICFVVISFAVTGYFVGLQAPMNPQLKSFGNGAYENLHSKTETLTNHANHVGVIPATHYSEMHLATKNRASTWRTSLTELKSSFDPLLEFEITPEQKKFALAMREQNRAFNGAPPTVPHAIDQMSSIACIACHGEGVRSETLRISKMSHQFLENCTQCHVENNPQHMPPPRLADNSFVGLPAPEGGPRAYQGAPPQIPHSTWMRVNCMSCHGWVGQQGIRTTHPWRTNCQQCHAPSAKLDQIQLDVEPQFLPPPKIAE